MVKLFLGHGTGIASLFTFHAARESRGVYLKTFTDLRHLPNRRMSDYVEEEMIKKVLFNV